MNYAEAVRSFVVDNLLFGDGDNLTEDTSFMESGVIDSTGIIEIVTFLEETFGIAIKDEELIPENLDSLRNIAHFLASKQQA